MSGVCSTTPEVGWTSVKVLSPCDDRLLGRYEARFALIRPDQHVAWRGDRLPADIANLIDCLTGVKRPHNGSAALR